MNPAGLPTLRTLLAMGLILAYCEAACRGEVQVLLDHQADAARLQFTAVPAPAINDAATGAEFALVDGDRDPNGGHLGVLHDGLVPTNEDQPSASFFFRPGTDGGRLRLDLRTVIAVKQVNTYSWHPNTRGPQVYQLYGADGASAQFNAAPPRDVDPTACGWVPVVRVDTRSGMTDPGGRYGVSVLNGTGDPLGHFRYLLFDVSRTEDRDPFGNTFYYEIDVLDADGPAPVAVTLPVESEPILIHFNGEGGRYLFTIDATAAPDLAAWAETELKPVVQSWYPKLVAMLPSEGFAPRTNLTMRFRSDMGGTPASAGGGRINLNCDWFRRELEREARGSVVHEMVHVVQNYGRTRRSNPNATRTPGWLVEGIADYIRWFLYEPETKGAEITSRNLSRARYDASYRITGNFLNWVTERYDPEIVRKLNIAAREGNYTESLWKDTTGKTLQQLGDEWRQHHETRLGGNTAD